jgi:hypothetical protein
MASRATRDSERTHARFREAAVRRVATGLELITLVAQVLDGASLRSHHVTPAFPGTAIAIA